MKNKYKGIRRKCCGCQKEKNIVMFNVTQDGTRNSECKACTGISDIDWAHELKRPKPKKELAKSTANRKRYVTEPAKDIDAKERKRLQMEAIYAKLKANLPLEELAFV